VIGRRKANAELLMLKALSEMVELLDDTTGADCEFALHSLIGACRCYLPDVADALQKMADAVNQSQFRARQETLDCDGKETPF
jgi:hypothetical protein